MQREVGETVCVNRMSSVDHSCEWPVGAVLCGQKNESCPSLGHLLRSRDCHLHTSEEEDGHWCLLKCACKYSIFVHTVLKQQLCIERTQRGWVGSCVLTYLPKGQDGAYICTTLVPLCFFPYYLMKILKILPNR